MNDPEIPPHRKLFLPLIQSLSAPPGTTHETGSRPSSLGLYSGTDSSSGQEWQQHHGLLTLHVLFPGLVLPALDLLDRKLIARYVLIDGEEGGTCGQKADELESYHRRRVDQCKTQLPPDEGVKPETRKRAHIHIAQSMASSNSRCKREARRPPKRYLVHLDAWSCSCASFALDAYPSNAGAQDDSKEVAMSAVPSSFGGLSLDGLRGSMGDDVPCCKHLLASFLAETGGSFLVDHVEERLVTKAELFILTANL